MNERRSLPIAVFDSGVGGLTVLHECLVSLPEEDFLYLGDSARFPYGTKSAEELRGCVERNTRYDVVKEYDAPPTLAQRRSVPQQVWA